MLAIDQMQMRLPLMGSRLIGMLKRGTVREGFREGEALLRTVPLLLAVICFSGSQARS